MLYTFITDVNTPVKYVFVIILNKSFVYLCSTDLLHILILYKNKEDTSQHPLCKLKTTNKRNR